MTILLFIHTLRHLRLRQIIYQLKYRLLKSKFHAAVAPNVSSIKFQPWIDKCPCLEGDKFCFLSVTDSFKSWNYIGHGMLWAYNLNYMDWLLQPDMSYGDGEKWIDTYIAAYHDNTVGKDPYPIALRAINWIKFIAKNHKYIGKAKFKEWNDSLYSQCLHLTRKLEYHLLGNHLLEDAYSIFIAAIYFGDRHLYKKAVGLLQQELDEQLLPDGAHYEQSPMYHCILLDRLLDCCNFSFNNVRFKEQEKFNHYLCEKAIRMLGHLDNISYTDGSIPLFNDSAVGIAPTPLQIKDYASRLGIVWQPLMMKECGYRKMENAIFEAFVDIGNLTATYQPGHTHADTFSYELRIKGKPFIIDTGISTYNKTARRQYERGTIAHNTVSINDRDSSEVWGGFRVGKRAKVDILTDQTDEIRVSHNGYGKRYTHDRRFSMHQKSFMVDDSILQKCNAVSYIHLAPSVRIISHDDSTVVTDVGVIRISGTLISAIDDCEVSERYNELIPTKVIKCKFNKDMSYAIHVLE